MKAIYGKIFKDLRLERGYSIKEITSDEVSIASISKFENGQSSLSVDRVIMALSKMHVELSEYSVRLEQEQTPLFPPLDFDFKIQTAYKSRNIAALAHDLLLVNEALQRGEDSSRLQYYRLYLPSLLAYLNPKIKGETPEILEIYRHLMKVETWGTYELALLPSAFTLPDTQKLQQLFDKLVLFSGTAFLLINQVKNKYVGIVNLLDSLIRKADWKFIEKVLHYLEKNPIPNDLMDVKTWIKFEIGLYHYKSGAKEEGLREMEEMVKVCQALDSEHFVNIFQTVIDHKDETEIPPL